MLVQSNFSVSREGFQPNMEVSVNGYSFIIAEIMPTEAGKGKQYKGVLTLPDGSKKSFMDRPVFVTKLNEYAGAKGTKGTSTKKDASHNTGESKVVKVSNLSEARINELVSFHHADLQKRFAKLVSQSNVANEELRRVFVDFVNRSTTDLRNRLEAMLAKQREELSIAKKAEAQRVKKVRFERLQSYVSNYDTYVGKVFMEGNMELAMKLRLTKAERILRANTLIEEILK